MMRLMLSKRGIEQNAVEASAIYAHRHRDGRYEDGVLSASLSP